jgi:hypothetical protein
LQHNKGLSTFHTKFMGRIIILKISCFLPVFSKVLHYQTNALRGFF